MKRGIILFFIFLVPYLSVNAQFGYIQSTIHRYSIGVGGGITDFFTGYEHSYIKPAGLVNLDYNITSYISAGAEFDYGMLSSGGIKPQYHFGDFTVNNSIIGYNANVRIGLGQFLKKTPKSKFLWFIRGLYAGGGIGMVNSNIRLDVKTPPPPDAIGTFMYHSASLVFILDDGIMWDLPKIFGIYDLGLKLNLETGFPQGYNIDGNYKLLAPHRTASDVYNFYTISIYKNFGRFR